MSQSETFSIRQMVELTGLTEFTIRGWENRYKAFKPHRGDTGRREYRKDDIERALLLRELLKRGHKVGRVANLGTKRLQDLFSQAELERSSSRHGGQPEPVSRFSELLALQKWTELKAFVQKVSTHNTRKLISDFFLPALKELASGFEAGVISIAQEHVASSLLKEKIYAALVELEAKNALDRNRRKSHFVLAAPEGDHHDIGLLLAHLLIRSYGLVSLNLGPHTPVRDLSETALRFEASHLLVVATVSKKGGARQETLSFLSEVQRQVGSHLQIIVAGSQAPVMPHDLRSSLLSFGSFHEFDDYLKGLTK